MADRPYIPLVAGMELVRRSGNLTQFPPDYLLGNIPRPGGFVYRAPPELVGQPIQFGMSNSLWRQYQIAGGVDPLVTPDWPWTGWSPAGVVPEGPDYLRLAHTYQAVSGGPFASEWVPGTHVGVYTDPDFAGIVNEPYSSTLAVSGVDLAPTGLVYPSGTYATVDEYVAACGLPAVPNDESEIFRHTHTVEWVTPIFGITGERATMIGKSNNENVDLSSIWGANFLAPFPADEFSSENSLQGLYGNVDKIYARIWAAPDSELTENGVLAKALLHSFNDSQPTGIIAIVGLPFRDWHTLNATEIAYIQSVSGMTDVTLLPGTIPRSTIGFIGPTFKNILVDTIRERKIDGVWTPGSSVTNTVSGLTAANTVIAIHSGTNKLTTALVMPTVQIEQVYVPGN